MATLTFTSYAWSSAAAFLRIESVLNDTVVVDWGDGFGPSSYTLSFQPSGYPPTYAARGRRSIGPNYSSDGPHTITISGTLSDWTELSLIDCKISECSDLSGLIALERLSLSDSFLTGLPPGVDALTNLIQLDLSYNFIKGDTPDMTNSPNLNVMRLSGNGFTKLKDVSVNAHLRELYVDHNPLESYLGASLPGVLGVLRCDYCNFDSASLDIFAAQLADISATTLRQEATTTRTAELSTANVKIGDWTVGGTVGTGYLYDPTGCSARGSYHSCEIHLASYKWFYTDATARRAGFNVDNSEWVTLLGDELPDPLNVGGPYQVAVNMVFDHTPVIARPDSTTPFLGENPGGGSAVASDEYPYGDRRGGYVGDLTSPPSYPTVAETWWILEKGISGLYLINRPQWWVGGSGLAKANVAPTPADGDGSGSTTLVFTAKKARAGFNGGDNVVPSVGAASNFLAVAGAGDDWHAGSGVLHDQDSNWGNEVDQATGLGRPNWIMQLSGHADLPVQSGAADDWKMSDRIRNESGTRFDSTHTLCAGRDCCVLVFVFNKGVGSSAARVASITCAGKTMTRIGSVAYDPLSDFTLEAFLLYRPPSYNCEIEVRLSGSTTKTVLVVESVRDAGGAAISYDRQNIHEASIGKLDWNALAQATELCVVTGIAPASGTFTLTSPDLETFQPGVVKDGPFSASLFVGQTGVRYGSGVLALPGYWTWAGTDTGVAKLLIFRPAGRVRSFFFG